MCITLSQCVTGRRVGVWLVTCRNNKSTSGRRRASDDDGSATMMGDETWRKQVANSFLFTVHPYCNHQACMNTVKPQRRVLVKSSEHVMNCVWINATTHHKHVWPPDLKKNTGLATCTAILHSRQSNCLREFVGGSSSVMELA